MGDHGGTENPPLKSELLHQTITTLLSKFIEIILLGVCVSLFQRTVKSLIVGCRGL